jgi:hypothetical protein
MHLTPDQTKTGQHPAPKLFRGPADELKPMTIAMAFKCKDGAVVAADRQGTALPSMLNSEITKVFKISDRSVIALSFQDFNWASRFARFARDSSVPEDQRIEDALHEYHAYARGEFPSGVPNDGDLLEGVLAMRDPTENDSLNCRLFDFSSVGPMREETEHGRVMVGSGYRRAEPLLKVVEFALGMLYGDIGEGEKWKRLSRNTVSKIAYQLLITLPAQEGYVHGATIFELGERVKHDNIQKDVLGDETYPFEAVVNAAKKDIRPPELIRLARRLNLIPPHLDKVVDLDDLEREFQTWD